MYRLYLDEMKYVKRYDYFKNMNENYQKTYSNYYKKCIPLIFTLNGKNKDSFKIEEIDSLTSLYENEKELIKEIKKYRTDYLTDDEKKSNHLNLTYKYNKYINRKPIIYNDKLIYKLSIHKRNKKESLPFEDELIHTISFIKKVSLSNISKIVLEPWAFSELDFDDRINIDVYDSSNKELMVPNNLPNLLKTYKGLMLKRKENISKSISTYEIDLELNNINRDIKVFFLSKYQNIRKIIEWELECERVFESSDDLRNKYYSFYEDLENDINYRRIYKKEIKEQQDYNEKIKFNNINIQKYYDHGGIEEVMNFVDLEEILSDEEDARKLGFSSRKK